MTLAANESIPKLLYNRGWSHGRGDPGGCHRADQVLAIVVDMTRAGSGGNGSDQPSGNGNHADLLVDQSNPSLGILHCINLSLIASAEALKLYI